MNKAIDIANYAIVIATKFSDRHRYKHEHDYLYVFLFFIILRCADHSCLRGPDAAGAETRGPTDPHVT